MEILEILSIFFGFVGVILTLVGNAWVEPAVSKNDKRLRTGERYARDSSSSYKVYAKHSLRPYRPWTRASKPTKRVANHETWWPQNSLRFRSIWPLSLI